MTEMFLPSLFKNNKRIGSRLSFINVNAFIDLLGGFILLEHAVSDGSGMVLYLISDKIGGSNS